MLIVKLVFEKSVIAVVLKIWATILFEMVKILSYCLSKISCP